MAQAIMDPEEVRRFASELKRFNEDVQSKASSLQARFAALSNTWQDQDAQKFAEEFVITMKALKKFVDVSEKHTPYLLRKASRIEAYLDQR
jgi:WXG100 family type VII secretion target